MQVAQSPGSAWVDERVGEKLKIDKRIADNTIGNALRAIEPEGVVAGLVRMVKAEHRRGNLKPDVLQISTVAIDGKNVGTLHWQDLLRLCGVEDGPGSVEEVREVLGKKYPYVQLHVPGRGRGGSKGGRSGARKPYGVIRQHNVTLISTQASPCIYARPIEAKTNEVGALPGLLKEVRRSYRRTKLFRLITTDAGNTSRATAAQIRSYGLDYFSAIKENHGEVWREARRILASLQLSRADATYSDKQGGKVVTYWVWVYELGEAGYVDWPHARQFVRVRRLTEDLRTGKRTVGNRFYVTSLPQDQLTGRQALKVCRAHWRIENNTHWTLDTQFGEDKRKLALSRDPNGMLVVAALRHIAMAIVGMLRALSRVTHTGEHPTWKEAFMFVVIALFFPYLDVEAFNAV